MHIDIHAVRKEFPVLQESIYFNVGTVGISPQSVVAQTLDSISYFETRGHLVWGECAEKMNDSRRRIAGLLGADPEEIAFTRNATDGTNLTINGISWREGDEVLLSGWTPHSLPSGTRNRDSSL